MNLVAHNSYRAPLPRKKHVCERASCVDPMCFADWRAEVLQPVLHAVGETVIYFGWSTCSPVRGVRAPCILGTPSWGIGTKKNGTAE